MQELAEERNHQRRGTGDPMIRPPRLVELEPRRIVIELRPEEWSALAAACGPLVSPAVYVRLVALRLASVEQAR